MPPVKLLIAEDDDDHAEILEMAIDEAPVSCEITRVCDGEEALQYLKCEGAYADALRPDLILLDINMPRVNGLQVAEFIKSNPALLHIPTIMMTTSNSDHDKRRAYDLHVNSYLVKPADFGDMMKMLADTLTYWSTWNRSLDGSGG